MTRVHRLFSCSITKNLIKGFSEAIDLDPTLDIGPSVARRNERLLRYASGFSQDREALLIDRNRGEARALHRGKPVCAS